MSRAPDARDRAAAPLALVVTCEHAGADLPFDLVERFADLRALLETHRGFDRGAISVFARLAGHAAASDFSTTSRLVVDLNRSVGHPRLFSEATRPLARDEREQVLRAHYWPYRTRVEERIAKLIDGGKRVLHVSVHSFVAVLDGIVRNAEIGLLYDPSRRLERSISLEWRRQLRAVSANELRVRMNYPYKGVSDGFTRHLRTRFADSVYAGLELEVNQSLLDGSSSHFPVSLIGRIEQSLLATHEKMSYTGPTKP